MPIKKAYHLLRRWLAKIWVKLEPQAKIIAVTGSVGKTSTTTAIATVLSQKFKTIQTDLNLDTIYNVPITALKIRPWHKKAVFELGVDKPGQMDEYLSVISPEIAVVTRIYYVHTDEEHLGSLENVVAEKGKLVEFLPSDGWAVLNWDDLRVRELAKRTKAKVIYYGLDKKHCQVWAEEITQKGAEGISFKVKAKLNQSSGDTQVVMPLLGKHNVYTGLAACAVGLLSGLSLETIARALKNVPVLEGRLSVEKGPLGTLLINDARRASPASTIAGLEAISKIPAPRRIAVLGEMGELGTFTENGHREVGDVLAKLEVDFVVGVGPLTKFILEEAGRKGMNKKQMFWAKNVLEAANFLKSFLKKGDLIYLKGSLLRHMERVILILEGKKVCCDLVVCPHYHLCRTCPKLGNVG